LRARKKDDNHDEIVNIFRVCGARILETYMIADCGFDFMALLRQRCYVVEVKDGNKPLSHRKLTVNEKIAQEYWGDNYYILETVDQTIKIVQKLYQH